MQSQRINRFAGVSVKCGSSGPNHTQKCGPKINFMIAVIVFVELLVLSQIPVWPSCEWNSWWYELRFLVQEPIIHQKIAKIAKNEIFKVRNQNIFPDCSDCILWAPSIISNRSLTILSVKFVMIWVTVFSPGANDSPKNSQNHQKRDFESADPK